MHHLIIVIAYVGCYALTVYAITPVQRLFLPEVTVFASLVYFPHGVRVLATWAYGWKAVPGLFVGSVIASLLLTPAEYSDLLQPALQKVIFVGSVVALIAFELARMFGRDFYWSETNKISWKGLVIIGAGASVLNSVGSTFVYSGLIGINNLDEVLLIYVAGDVIGLVGCMFALMYVFRWIRLFGKTVT